MHKQLAHSITITFNNIFYDQYKIKDIAVYGLRHRITTVDIISNSLMYSQGMLPYLSIEEGN